MKIIDRPYFEIKTSEGQLKNQLKIIEEAGRTSYQSFQGPITDETASKFVRMIRDRNHLSVLEHGSMTVGFYGVSRGMTHELVRHRLASPTQESTRYVDYIKGDENPDLDRFQVEMVFPPHHDLEQRVDLDDGRTMSPIEMGEEIERFYRGLRKSGWLPEDARQILPTALVSDIVLTANFREWRHIFELRTQKAAHWEIRRVMNDLLVETSRLLPAVFEDFQMKGRDKNGLAYYEIRTRHG
jgi:thymidylate synthase (FAD)